MKALIFRETGEPKSVLKLAEIPPPPLAAGEALVRVLASNHPAAAGVELASKLKGKEKEK